jgi:hypothetical protein
MTGHRAGATQDNDEPIRGCGPAITSQTPVLASALAVSYPTPE